MSWIFHHARWELGSIFPRAYHFGDFKIKDHKYAPRMFIYERSGQVLIRKPAQSHET